MNKAVFVNEKTGQGSVKLTYYYDNNDIVTRQDTESTIPYNALGVKDKEEAKSKLELFAKAYDGIEGLTHKIEYNEKDIHETLSIDYQKADFEKLKNLPGMMMDNKDGKAKAISFTKSKELLKQSGFVEQK